MSNLFWRGTGPRPTVWCDAWRGTGPRTTVRGEGYAANRRAGACPPQCLTVARDRPSPYGSRRVHRSAGACPPRCHARECSSSRCAGFSVGRGCIPRAGVACRSSSPDLDPFGIRRARTTVAGGVAAIHPRPSRTDRRRVLLFPLGPLGPICL